MKRLATLPLALTLALGATGAWAGKDKPGVDWMPADQVR